MGGHDVGRLEGRVGEQREWRWEGKEGDPREQSLNGSVVVMGVFR